MALTGKTAPRKRGKNGRDRERPKKKYSKSFFFFNNNSLFVSSSVPFPIPFLIPPLLPPPILPPPSSPILSFSSPGLPIIIPLISFFNFFYDTRF